MIRETLVVTTAGAGLWLRARGRAHRPEERASAVGFRPMRLTSDASADIWRGALVETNPTLRFPLMLVAIAAIVLLWGLAIGAVATAAILWPLWAIVAAFRASSRRRRRLALEHEELLEALHRS